MNEQELAWDQPGRCPSCGVVTDHTWYLETSAKYYHPASEDWIAAFLDGSQGIPLVSKCISRDCMSLALWIKTTDESGSECIELVYPLSYPRTPPREGLSDEETRLYKEATEVVAASRRAACALLRVLLEAFLKRHLLDAGHAVNGKTLESLIESAVQHLDLSPTLKDGLTAIRKRGNTAVHDPYGLTDDTRSEDLPWLFQAIDDLVDDLHVKPQKWAGMAGP